MLLNLNLHYMFAAVAKKYWIHCNINWQKIEYSFDFKKELVISYQIKTKMRPFHRVAENHHI